VARIAAEIAPDAAAAAHGLVAASVSALPEDGKVAGLPAQVGDP
jgi:hypothetical protein